MHGLEILLFAAVLSLVDYLSIDIAKTLSRSAGKVYWLVFQIPLVTALILSSSFVNVMACFGLSVLISYLLIGHKLITGRHILHQAW